jgi:hypothetical protein
VEFRPLKSPLDPPPSSSLRSGYVSSYSFSEGLLIRVYLGHDVQRPGLYRPWTGLWRSMSGTIPEIEGETVGSTQPVCPRCDWSVDYVSRTSTFLTESSTHRRLGCRTVAKIQEKVIKQSKRNGFHRFVVSKTDKDKIGAWKQDFVRVLHVFNVRSIRSVGHSFANPAAPFQTELAIDTNITVTDTKTVVTDTNTMVADLHRNLLAEWEGVSGQNRSVGTICYPSTTEC